MQLSPRKIENLSPFLKTDSFVFLVLLALRNDSGDLYLP